MITLSLVGTVFIVMLLLALSIALIEANGGYMGDHSMVPGLLIFGTGLCVALACMGLWFGNWSMTFN